MRNKVVSAAEGVSRIRSGDTLANSGFVGTGTPEELLEALERRFVASGIGAGMAGLSVAALLAGVGRRVLVLEAHDTPGGYAHTFTVKEHRFCAQVHYVFHEAARLPPTLIQRQALRGQRQVMVARSNE